MWLVFLEMECHLFLKPQILVLWFLFNFNFDFVFWFTVRSCCVSLVMSLEKHINLLSNRRLATSFSVSFPQYSRVGEMSGRLHSTKLKLIWWCNEVMQNGKWIHFCSFVPMQLANIQAIPVSCFHLFHLPCKSELHYVVKATSLVTSNSAIV